MASPLQPALIIGLGGSGIDIARRFRRRLHRDYPGAKHVRFLGIDTDPQSQETRDSQRLPDDEFHHAGNFAMAQYVGDAQINNFPQIRSWWRSYTNLPYAFISAGAGQRRPVGRLALFVHFEDIKSAIARQLRAIFQAESFNQLPPEYRRTITVYIVSSTCGGTGTGMFLDLAYVAQQLVPDEMPQVIPKVRGLLLMPSAFIGTGRVPAGSHTALRANAFGALSELDWCMTKTVLRDPVEFGTRTGKWSVRRDELAFKSVFLLGNQDAHGAIYTNWPDLVERGSAHLQITLTSELSKAGQSVLDNVESSMGAKSAVKGRSAMFSSMNADEILLPISRIKARWTKRFAAQLAGRLDEDPTRDAHGPAAASIRELDGSAGFGWLNRMALKDDLRTLVPRLPDYESAATAVDPERPDAEQLIRGAQELQNEGSRRIDRIGFGEQVNAAVRLVSEETDAALRRVLSTGSLDDALLLLTRIRERLDEIGVKAREQRLRLPGNWVPDFGERVRAVRRGLLQNRAAYARDLSTQASQALGSAALAWERVLWERFSQALEDSINLPLLRTHLERKRSQVERTGALLQSASALIQAVDEPSAAAGMAASISDDEIDAAFQQPDRQERLSLFASEGMGALIADESPTAEDIAVTLLTIAERAVANVASDFVAASSIPADRVAERLDRLQPLAVFTPEWDSLTQGSAAAPPERVALLGLPELMASEEEAQHGIRNRMQVKNRDFGTVPIPDDDRVLMMAQYHGFPLFALAEIGDCKRAYDSDPSTKELRLTLPDPDARRWSVEPATAHESAQWFAVALALGYVRLNAVVGGYVFRESTADERVLNRDERSPERSREQARDEFLRQGLADPFRRVLTGELSKGTESLYNRLQEWLEKESRNLQEKEYPAAFRVDVAQVSEYAKSIRWT